MGGFKARQDINSKIFNEDKYTGPSFLFWMWNPTQLNTDIFREKKSGQCFYYSDSDYSE